MLKKPKAFHLLLGMGLISVILDGATAYTVNHIEQVGATCNMILHLLFLLSLDTFIFLVYIYMLYITKGIPKSKNKRSLLFLPYLINAIVLIINIPDLEYRTGIVTNYSMGWSAYTCFATLVENKDGSTGGHIKRTSGYVRLIVEELRRRGHYKNILTKDYVNDLYLAAPMHDIGKISIPDAILQKPGKLTQEEFELMKQHTKKGGEIIKETFGHLGNESYTKIAYQVAEYHHEK